MAALFALSTTVLWSSPLWRHRQGKHGAFTDASRGHDWCRLVRRLGAVITLTTCPEISVQKGHSRHSLGGASRHEAKYAMNTTLTLSLTRVRSAYEESCAVYGRRPRRCAEWSTADRHAMSVTTSVRKTARAQRWSKSPRSVGSARARCR